LTRFYYEVSLKRVRGAARIARQPSKLNVLGSNPSGPANFNFKLESG
jgi:hypothetical protein